jgi:hypothetical protein
MVILFPKFGTGSRVVSLYFAKLNYIFTITHTSFTILEALDTGEERRGERSTNLIDKNIWN